MCKTKQKRKVFFFFQAEDGIRDLVRSRGVGDVDKRQVPRLLEYYEKNLRGVMPRSRYNEIVSFLKSGVRDLSLIHI